MERIFCLYIFLISVVLQNFSLITTNNFGIAASTIILIFLTIQYKLFERINKQFTIFLISLTISIFLSCALNRFLDLMQIIRVYMIAFDGWASYSFIKKMYEIDSEMVWYAFMNILLIMCIYGIYQYIATKINFPHFMNVFNNNTSYKPRGIYDYFGGWTKSKGRIYGVCSEPSFYASILCIYFIILVICPYKKGLYKLNESLLIINILLTGSRSGWAMLLCIIIAIALETLFRKEKILQIILVIGIFSIPFINLAIMNLLINNNYYNDVSAYSRTYSSLYYLAEIFRDPIVAIIGHSVGYSWSLDWSSSKYIEAVSHNGYIEVMYTFGIAMFLLSIYMISRMLQRIKSKRVKILFWTATVSLCIFGFNYNIESITEMFGCLYACCLQTKSIEKDPQNKQYVYLRMRR